MIDKLGASTVNFIITIILARLLLPEDFGIVAMVMVFFEVSSTFIESGFYTALVREKSISENDKSTTFIFNLITAVLLYILLFFLAPSIALWFGEPILVPIIRIMGLNLIIFSFSIIQRAKLTHQIDFKTQTKVRFFAVIISGGVAVIMAYSGFGVWSLVAKIGLMAFLDTLFLWIMSPWKPNWVFNPESFKRLFGFGSKILLSSLLDRFYQQIYKLLIGKFFSSAMLGFYTQASNFSNIVVSTLFRTLDKITYPILSKLQEDKARLKSGFRKVVKMSSFFIIPAMVLLAVLAKPVIVFLIGEKWLPAVPFLQLLCLSGVTLHLSQINLNVLLVLGRSDLSLKLEVFKKINITIAILIGIRFGVFGLIIGEVISSYLNLIINGFYSKTFLDYALIEQIRDVLLTIAFSIITGLIVLLITRFFEGMEFLQVIIGTFSGIACYLGLHQLSGTEEIKILRKTIIPQTLNLIKS